MPHVTLQTLKERFPLHRRTESESAQFGRDARTDWQLVFVVFIILNLISFAANVFMYRRINHGEMFLVSKREPLSLRVLNRAELAEAAKFLAKKRETFERLQASSLVIPSPGPARAKK